MGRVFLLLHYYHGHLLFQHLERQSSSVLLFLTVGSETYLLVTGLPDAVHLNFLRQWIGLSSIGGIRSKVPAQPDCAPGGWPPRFDGLECVEKSCFKFSGMFPSLSFYSSYFGL